MFASLKTRLPASVSSVPAGAIETSVAAILAPGEKGLEILFIRRAEREGDPWSGHIALPGGRREAGDSDLLATAVRETREEIGVALPLENLLGPLPDLNPSMPQRPPLVIRPYVFGLEAKPEWRPSAEVVESFWVPLDSLAPCDGTAVVSIQGQRIQVPCFRVAGLPPGLVVWGLTYRILRGLLPLLG